MASRLGFKVVDKDSLPLHLVPPTSSKCDNGTLQYIKRPDGGYNWHCTCGSATVRAEDHDGSDVLICGETLPQKKPVPNAMPQVPTGGSSSSLYADGNKTTGPEVDGNSTFMGKTVADLYRHVVVWGPLEDAFLQHDGLQGMGLTISSKQAFVRQCAGKIMNILFTYLKTGGIISVPMDPDGKDPEDPDSDDENGGGKHYNFGKEVALLNMKFDYLARGLSNII